MHVHIKGIHCGSGIFCFSFSYIFCLLFILLELFDGVLQFWGMWCRADAHL